MNRTFKLSLLCAGIFACGVVAGGLGARKFIKPPHHAQPPPSGGQPEGFGPQQLRRLSDELGLSDVQREKLLPILEKAGDELRQLRRESWKQSSAIIETMESAVAEQLTPGQRSKLKILQEERNARMKARMEERNRRKSEGGDMRRDGENPERRPGMPPPPGGIPPSADEATESSPPR